MGGRGQWGVELSSVGVVVVRGCSMFGGGSWSSRALDIHGWGLLSSMGIIVVRGRSRYVVGVIRGCSRFVGEVAVVNGGVGCVVSCLWAVEVVRGGSFSSVCEWSWLSLCGWS